MGQGINKVATIAEIVKHRVKGLHQINEIKTQTFEDLIESKDEENKEVSVSRKVTCLIIVLTLNAPSGAERKGYGYQEPIPESEVIEEEQFL